MAKDAPKSAEKAAPAKKAGLYDQLDALTEKALLAGDTALYATLHPTVVGLAAAKVAAKTALSKVDGEAAELLEQIVAL